MIQEHFRIHLSSQSQLNPVILNFDKFNTQHYGLPIMFVG